MIFDTLENLECYTSTHPRFEAAFAFLREMMTKDPAPGRYEMPNGDAAEAVIVNVFDYETKPMSPAVQMEAHRRYIDVQVVLEGKEYMYVPGVSPLAVTVPYRRDTDIEFFEMPCTEDTARCMVSAGYFAVFYANELHAPGISLVDTPTRVRKFVVKILDET